MAVRNGQVFVMGAAIFVSLLIIGNTGLTEIQTFQQHETENFFENVFGEPVDVFNNALKDNRTLENAEKEVYSWNSFASKKAASRNLQYSSIHLIILPEKGKTSIINYRSEQAEVNLSLNGNFKQETVEAWQSSNRSFEPGDVDVKFSVPRENIETSFNASSPRLFTFLEISSGREKWRDTSLG